MDLIATFDRVIGIPQSLHRGRAGSRLVAVALALVATQQGPKKTFSLRGIKEAPPYFHDGRLLTLEDTVEFFNLILETRLETGEKQALVAFLRQL